MASKSQKQEPDSQPEPQEVMLDESEPEPAINGRGPVSWDPSVQLGPGLVNEHFLDSTKAQSSVASHSSVVNDHGDARHLSENRGPSTAKSSSDYGSSTTDLMALGAGFANHDDIPNLRESDISGQGVTVPLSEVTGEISIPQSTEEENLGESIRAAFQRSAAVREGKDFLPINELDRIVTRNRIRQELANLPRNLSPEQLDHLTDEIWEVKSPLLSKSSNNKTTRRRIFVILALMQKVGQIVDFIKEGLFDSHLPFTLSEGTRKGLRQLVRRGDAGQSHSIQLFAKWPVYELECFDTFQWELLAPYFHLSTKNDPKILHYNLESKIIMPFIEDHEVKHVGGYGDVWRVKIHPAHHNHCEDLASEDDNPSFAVKRLRHNNPNAFDAEVSNLKKFSARDHLHLIKLLVTFSWREQYYLLFPWADGNLVDFWKKYPEPSDLKRDYNFILWFAKQCLGIAEGLKMIHTLDKPDVEELDDGSRHQIHGRHGDLKPENILWFKEYQDTDPNCAMGVLKISDFGLTRFHGTLSKSHINAESIAVTGTYRAPEYDVYKVVSQSYDIWTLGCVLLEFVTWYLLGWEEVDKFSKNRAKEHISEWKEDVFFNFVNMKDDEGRTQIGARAKQSVADEFQYLYQHHNCSDFMLDLLEFIEKRLLRMGPQNRAQCDEIVGKLAELDKKCSSDRQYCMLRVNVAPARSGTDLSLLSFTPEMAKRIHRNPLPVYSGPLETHSEARDSPPLAENPGVSISTHDFVFPERMHHEPEGIDSSAESRRLSHITASAILPRALERSNSTEVESQSSRPQSPTKKVHFQAKTFKDKLEASPNPDVSARDYMQEEEPESPLAQPSSTLPDNFMLSPPLPSNSQLETHEAPTVLESGAESSTASAPANLVVSADNFPTKRSTIVNTAAPNLRVDDDTVNNSPSSDDTATSNNGIYHVSGANVANGSATGGSLPTHQNDLIGQSTNPIEKAKSSSINVEPKKHPRWLKGLFCGLCCTGDVD